MIRSATYPKGFRIDKTIKPYDGTAKPATWLQDYGNAVEIAGGNPNVAVKYLPLMLAGTTRQWIDDLPEKSIYNWLDMQEAFTKNFEGTYKRLCTSVAPSSHHGRGGHVVHAAHPLTARRKEQPGAIRCTLMPRQDPRGPGSTIPGTMLLWTCDTVRNLPQGFPD